MIDRAIRSAVLAGFLAFALAFIGLFELALPIDCYDLADRCENEGWWSLLLWAGSFALAAVAALAVLQIARRFER